MLSVLYTTISNKEDAKKIAKYLIENKFAACVNVIGPAVSYYHWNGTLQEDEEYILLIKTPSEIKNEVMEVIKKIHTYSKPCIYELSSSADCDKEFEKWVCEQTLMRQI